MNYKPYYDLNLPKEGINKNFDFGQFNKEKFPFLPIVNVKTVDIVTPEVLSILKSNNLYVNPVTYIFRKYCNENLGIHLDTMGKSGDELVYWGINYIVGSDDSEMIWYEPKNNDGPKVGFTQVGTSYASYNDDEVNIIERYSFKGPTLVRTDIPHSAHNYDPTKVRWCVSIRGGLCTNVNGVLTGIPSTSWEQAVNFFSNLVKFP